MLQNRAMTKTRMWLVAPVFVLASLVFMPQDVRAAAPVRAVVAAPAGKLQGRVEAGLLTFKGTPYAAPPVGELRWRAPQPALPCQGTRPALERGVSCIQKPSLSIDSGAGDPRPMGEDRLNLNLWTPRADPAAKLPVVVWIHGGALIFGAGGLPTCDGTPLAQRAAVLVTINHRLGALGFFAHPSIAAEQPGADVNFGLLDQIAALRWIRQNIAAFGSDPGNVTIFGQSAGAESVPALFTSPLAKSLFQKGIAQSQYGIPSHTLTQARATAAQVATALQLNGAPATAADLHAVPAEAFEKLDANELSLAPGFIVGDPAVPKPILEVFQSGGEAPVPRNASAWPRDSQRDSTLLEFGEADGVRADFMKARVHAFVGTPKVMGAFTAVR